MNRVSECGGRALWLVCQSPSFGSLSLERGGAMLMYDCAVFLANAFPCHRALLMSSFFPASWFGEVAPAVSVNGGLPTSSYGSTMSDSAADGAVEAPDEVPYKTSEEAPAESPEEFDGATEDALDNDETGDERDLFDLREVSGLDAVPVKARDR